MEALLPATNTNDNVDEEVQRILRVSGIESSPMDSSSLNVLKELIQERRHKAKTTPSTHPRKATTATSITASRVQSNTNILLANQLLKHDDGDDPVLEQLKLQTTLLLDMRQRIDELTAKVDRLEASSIADVNENIKISSTTRYFLQKPSNSATTTATTTATPAAAGAAFGSNDNVPAGTPAAENNNEQIQPQEEEQGVFGCIVEIGRVFWNQSRGYVRPLDGALLFKLMFMVLVVSSRVSRANSRHHQNSNNNSNSNPYSEYKIRMITSLLIVGFLYHTRYLQYLYQFFWKDNVPMRIWKGEDNIVIQPPGTENENRQEQQQQQPNNNDDNNIIPRPLGEHVVQNDNNPEAQGNGQQQQEEQQQQQQRNNGFLWGGIAPPLHQQQDENGNNNPIVGLVHDIFYLFGSFIFSILPMWNPEQQQQQRQQLQPPVQLEGRQQPQHQPGIPQQIQNDNVEIPRIQPPRDAMEAASDDDNSEDDDSSSSSGSD